MPWRFVVSSRAAVQDALLHAWSRQAALSSSVGTDEDAVSGQWARQGRRQNLGRHVEASECRAAWHLRWKKCGGDELRACGLQVPSADISTE